jgi:hypothetical protein
MASTGLSLATWVAWLTSVAALSRALSRWLEAFFARIYLAPLWPSRRASLASRGGRPRIPQAKRIEPFLGASGPWP